LRLKLFYFISEVAPAAAAHTKCRPRRRDATSANYYTHHCYDVCWLCIT